MLIHSIHHRKIWNSIIRKFYDAYSRIFARCGIPEVAIVKSDSGMMGGSISHEYMLLTPVGEDSIAICPECGYSANVEAAPSIIKNENKIPKEELKESFNTWYRYN